VHDGVEVQVDRVAGGEPGGGGGSVQGGQERGLFGVFEPVGVAGQRGGLGQRGQAGEQRRAGVGGEVFDVGDPAGRGEFEGQQAQQVVRRRDDVGAGVAGGGHQGGQVQGQQVRDCQQQPGHVRRRPGRQLGEVELLGAGQHLTAGSAACGVGASPQPREPLLTDAPAILGPAWDELDQRWWLGPTEELLRQAMTEGTLVATDPRLLATALLGSLTALGHTIAAHPDSATQHVAESVLLTLTQGLHLRANP